MCACVCVCQNQDMLCFEFYKFNLAANSKVCSQSGSRRVPLVFAGDVLEVAVKLLCPAGVSRGAVVDLLREAKSAVS